MGLGAQRWASPNALDWREAAEFPLTPFRRPSCGEADAVMATSSA